VECVSCGPGLGQVQTFDEASPRGKESLIEISRLKEPIPGCRVSLSICWDGIHSTYFNSTMNEKGKCVESKDLRSVLLLINPA
jgi:hypothetical protein